MIRTMLIFFVLIGMVACGSDQEQTKTEETEVTEETNEEVSYDEVWDKYFFAETLKEKEFVVSSYSVEELKAIKHGESIAARLASNAEPSTIELIIQNHPAATADSGATSTILFWSALAKRDFGVDMIDLNIMNQYGFNGGNCLHFVASRPDNPVWFDQIVVPEDINEKDYLGRTPLHIAIHAGYTKLAVWLLDHGASLSVRDERDNTPLHYLMRFQEEHVEDWLAILAQHPEWTSASEIYDDQGFGPIFGPASSGNELLFNKLVDSGWDPYFPTKELGTSAFHTLQMALGNVEKNGDIKDSVVMPPPVNREK